MATREGVAIQRKEVTGLLKARDQRSVFDWIEAARPDLAIVAAALLLALPLAAQTPAEIQSALDAAYAKYKDI